MLHRVCYIVTNDHLDVYTTMERHANVGNPSKSFSLLVAYYMIVHPSSAFPKESTIPQYPATEDQSAFLQVDDEDTCVLGINICRKVVSTNCNQLQGSITDRKRTRNCRTYFLIKFSTAGLIFACPPCEWIPFPTMILSSSRP